MTDKNLEERVNEEKTAYIFDTSVVLHDANSIYQYGNNDIIITSDLIKEADKFKKGNDDRAYNAREISRILDELTEQAYRENVDMHKEGMSLGPGKGKLYLATPVEEVPENADSTRIQPESEDHRFILEAVKRQSQYKKKPILVSKDTNVRLLARSIKVPAEDYMEDSAKEETIDLKFGQVEEFHGISGKVINHLYNKGKISAQEVFSEIEGVPTDPEEHIANQFYILKHSESSSAVVRFQKEDHTLKKVENLSYKKISPKDVKQTAFMDLLFDDEIQLVFAWGPAGTGKTLLASAAGLSQTLGGNSKYNQMIYTRRTIPTSKQDELGFLPGDKGEKMAPWTLGFKAAIDTIQGNQKGSGDSTLDTLIASGNVIVETIEHLRGTNFPNSYFICDEAQNLTPQLAKTIITRMAEGTKIIMMGDPDQRDSIYLGKRDNGLIYAADRLMNKKSNQDRYRAGAIYLDTVQRSELADLAVENL